MRTIRISDEVWAAIAERGKFGETEDDVLRRILEIPEAPQTVSRPRGAKIRMSAGVDGNDLAVSFATGARERWPLPNRNDREALRTLRSEAVSWARSQGASPGQEDAVKKALTSAGFHLRR